MKLVDIIDHEIGEVPEEKTCIGVDIFHHLFLLSAGKEFDLVVFNITK